MVEKHSDVCDSDDIVPYAQKFDVDNPQVHEDVFWCDGCKNELSITEINGEEVFVV